jgi:hypothetical protein
MSGQDNNEKQNQNENEFVIRRNKGFSNITYLSIVSKIVMGDNAATLETSKRWIYFIKGTPRTISIDYNSITSIEVKTIFSFWDLIFAVFFLIVFISTLEIWLLALIVLFLLCSFGRNIEISRNNRRKIIIPADGIGSEKQVIMNICDVIRSKAANIGDPAPGSTESKKQNILDSLPFKTLIERKIPREKIENNPALKTIVPHSNLIAVWLIVLMVLIGGIASSTNSIGSLIRQYGRLADKAIELYQNTEDKNSASFIAKSASLQKKMEKLMRKAERNKHEMTDEQAEELIRIMLRLALIGY